MIIKICEYRHMSSADIYDMLQLRAEVFVVEQNCPYQDLDGKDLDAWHCLARNADEKAIGCCRVFMCDEKYAQIGRVATSKDVRGKGIGYCLMDSALKVVERRMGNAPIKIHAQSYAVGFYEKFGFVVSSDEFLEDGIPHREMVRIPD